MKKLLFSLAALALLLASCQTQEKDFVDEKVTAPEIVATVETDSATRTLIDVDQLGEGTIYWTPFDEINIFYGTLNTHYTSQNTANATTAVFRTTDVIGSTESASTNIWGLYPYDANATSTGSAISTTLPATQYGVPDTFDDDLYITLAHSTSTALKFYNVCGGIKFSLSRGDITSITFKGNNNEPIAGDISLTFENGLPKATVVNGLTEITLTPKTGNTFAQNTNYYIVAIPGTLTGGFTMTFTTSGGALGTFNYTTGTVTIKRSIFSKKAEIDTYATFTEVQPNNVIYYTSSDGNKIDPYASDVFGANIISNEYVNGKGVITFDGDVRRIGKNAFYQCENLTTLSIPKSVTSIGDWAFGYCSSISSVVIPEGVRSIGGRAFLGCTSLASIFIPSSVTSIGVFVFNQCSKLASITVSSSNTYYDSRDNCNAIIRTSDNKLVRGCNNTIVPNSIISIEAYAFSDCFELASVTIPSTVTSIGYDAFYHCSSIRSISIPEGITCIESETFVGCTSLRTISLPRSITSIKDYAFLRCSSLESIIIPESVTNIGQSAFSGCSLLASINLPENLKTIWDCTFLSCSSLTTIDLPSNLSVIRPSAFNGCSGLLSITIPESVQYIQSEAFYNCSSLTSITVECVTPPSGSSPGSYLMFDNTGNCPIYVPAESVAAYKASQDWKSYASRIQAIPE